MYYNITGITARLDSGQGRHPRLERRGQPSPHHPFTPVALTEARGSNASRSVHQPAHRRSSGPPVIPPAADNHNSQTRLRRSDESESITATTATGPATGHSPGLTGRALAGWPRTTHKPNSNHHTAIIFTCGNASAVVTLQFTWRGAHRPRLGYLVGKGRGILPPHISG